MEVWKLRADAASEDASITLPQLGRVLLHINQRRGYKHTRFANENDDSKSNDSNFLSKMDGRYASCKKENITVGQYFYKHLKESECISSNGKKYYTYTIKNEVFPRQAYKEEFDAIMEVQKKRFPELTTEVIADLADAIFYQRPLKSCKHLVSSCDFIKELDPSLAVRTLENNQPINIAPKVAHKTSPLAQICQIYEVVNNLKFPTSQFRRKPISKTKVKKGEETTTSQITQDSDNIEISLQQRQELINLLKTKAEISYSSLLNKIGIELNEDEYLPATTGKNKEKSPILDRKIIGFGTYTQLKKALSTLSKQEQERLLQFNLKIDEVVDKATGLVYEIVSNAYMQEPLYQLWHTLYAIEDPVVLHKVLIKKFGIEDPTALGKLEKIDFRKESYTNKSAKLMRMVLPDMMQGVMYNDACQKIKGRYKDNSIKTAEVSQNDTTYNPVKHFKPGSLRQPLVEKVLNQTVTLINKLTSQYGHIDEVRIELARELKSNGKQREKINKQLNDRTKDNDSIRILLRKEYGIQNATNANILKYRLLRETGERCIYCDKPVDPLAFLYGVGVEKEHIIPKSRFFNNSFQNLVCSCKKCNQDKGSTTGLDFITHSPVHDLESYIKRVNELYADQKISKEKRNYLLMKGENIPTGFINRDLTVSQYIAKAMFNHLEPYFPRVYSTSGSVTSYLRYQWGYEDILHNLNFKRYSEAQLVEEVKSKDKTITRIKFWDKRRDHRHHAIDALVIALTRQNYITYLNSLNVALQDCGKEGVNNKLKTENRDTWCQKQPHIKAEEVQHALSGVVVSYQSINKLSTIARTNSIDSAAPHTRIPRRALHESTVYGRILMPFSSNRNNYMRCLKYVKRRDVAEITEKNVENVVDGGVRELIRKSLVSKSKEDKRIYWDENKTMEIKKVRFFINKIKDGKEAKDEDNKIPLRYSATGEPMGFVNHNGNHHIAIYDDQNGDKIKPIQHIATTWTCIKRQKYGLPIIIENPEEVWNLIDAMPDSKDLQELKKSMPPRTSKLKFYLGNGDAVILGLTDDEITEAMARKDIQKLTKHIHRLTTISLNDYTFRNLYDTQKEIIVEVTEKTQKKGEKVDSDKPKTEKKKEELPIKTQFTEFGVSVRSLNKLLSLNPRKIIVDCIGNISLA